MRASVQQWIFCKFLRLLPAWNGLSTGTALVRRPLPDYNGAMTQDFPVQADSGKLCSSAVTGQMRADTPHGWRRLI